MAKILNAMVFYADGKSPPGIVPAIEHEGRVWLAPWWIELPEQKAKTPKHIIPIDLFRYQKEGPPGVDYVVNAGLPRELFARETPKEWQSKYQIVERPNITFPTE